MPLTKEERIDIILLAGSGTTRHVARTCNATHRTQITHDTVAKLKKFRRTGSYVAVLGLPGLLSLVTNFGHSVMGYLRSVGCIACTCYMTGGTTPSQQNDVNPFFLR